jgi:hypothetical protein
MKRREPATADPRAHRAARLEELIELYGGLAYEGPWPAELERVRSGQPFEVSGSGLPKECRPSMTGRYLVESDGTVTPIRPTTTNRRRQ